MTFPITINGRFMTRQATGVDRFALELLQAWWPQFGLGRSAALAMPMPDYRTDGTAPVRQELTLDMPFIIDKRLGGHAWEQLRLPRLRPESVLLNLCNSAPMTRKRQVVVLHDAGVVATPKSYSFAYRNWHRLLMAGIMRRADVVVAVSKFSASEIARHVGGRRGPIEVVYEGGEHVLREPADTGILRRLNLGRQKYILAVGSSNPNKNLISIIRAEELLKDLDIKVVAVGGVNRRVFGDSTDGATTLVAAGYVSDAELRALYEGAECFVFPSFYEGFGLPPLEAMHCGCPVISSNRASMPEVCGDAAVYCNPDDPADIARCIRRVIESAGLRQELRESGYLRARQFSWSRAATQFEAILARNFSAGTS